MCKSRALVLAMLVSLLLTGALPAVAQASMGDPAMRIQFQRGATSAVVSGQLAAHATHDYVLRASAGQIMQVVLWPEGAAGLLIWGADGTPLKNWPDQGQGWQGRLPRTQDYTVQVISLDQPLSYCLRVTVMARIQFAAGSSSATRSSPMQTCIPQAAEVVGGYAFRASAQQTVRVTLASPNHNVYLTLVGADGVPVKYYDDWSTSWEGRVPTTQDYYLLPVAVGSDSRFTLSVWIGPRGQPAPTRIRFAPGATSATVSGSLAPGASARYVLWAGQGQRLEIHVWPAPGEYAPPSLDVAVGGPGGASWTGLPLDSVLDPLPASGDYIITLGLRPGSPGTSYVMEVVIPAR
jgi:hypothetical protein